MSRKEQQMKLLQVKGNQIVDEDGASMILRGIGLGGWLSMENWIMGYPAHEQGMRDSVRKVLGEECANFFFDRFTEYFFAESDAEFISSLGLNVVRIPFHYRLLEDDSMPFEIREEGFLQLDRAIELCARHNIYSILDLHSVPGWQNGDWHCDNPTHISLFWQHRTFQDRVVHLWEALAQRYANCKSVAGYNPLNEPAASSGPAVAAFYTRIQKAIRRHDENHILFLDGNRYGIDFTIFGAPGPNVVYSPHDYPAPAYTPDSKYPGYCHLAHITEHEEEDKAYELGLITPNDSPDQYFDRDVIERGFLVRTKYMRETDTPVLVGEFNAIFPGDEESDGMRLRLLADQLEIYKKYNASWIFWGYKDVGLVSPLTVARDSRWVRRIQPIIDKKARLGVDLWGGRLDRIDHILKPIKELFAAEFPHYSPFPWGSDFRIERTVPQILLADALIPEFGELFRGMTEDEIDEMMQSFRLENCVPRESLINLFRKAATD
jgi:endoglucanase